MQWAEYSKVPDHSKETQEIESFQYAGPLRIPPPVFQVRSRKEDSTIDTINARYVETKGASLKYQQTEFNKVLNEEKGIKKDTSKVNPFVDMAPLSSRTDTRDFRQSKPYDSTGPSLAMNPFFDRYYPAIDPRNIIRVVRSGVCGFKDSAIGIHGSERLRERAFTHRNAPEGSTSISLTEWQDLLRPKIDNIEVVYRPQGGLWALGSKDDLTVPNGSVQPPKP